MRWAVPKRLCAECKVTLAGIGDLRRAMGDIHFYAHPDVPLPLIQLPHASALHDFGLTIGGQESHGMLEFDGHWYAADRGAITLPTRLCCAVTWRRPETCPAKPRSGVYRLDIRVVSKEDVRDTSTSWYDDDVGAEICLTPTKIMRVHFQVVTVERKRVEKGE